MPASFTSMDSESQNRAKGNPLRFNALEKRSRQAELLDDAEAFAELAQLPFEDRPRHQPKFALGTEEKRRGP